MNFYIDLSRVALAPYPLYRPPKEQPIMKRQILATALSSILASSAFALPAAEQVTPQVKADAVHLSQTLARSGSQEDENRDYAKGAVAENGSQRANERAYTEGLTENGRNRLEQKGLVEGGADRLQERNAVAEGGSEQANDRAYAQGIAEGGADRLQELHQAQS